MFHLLKIEDIKHLSASGEVLWESNNIDNIFHQNGELYLLSVAFVTGGAISIPSSYYLGLDNRSTPAFTDTLLSLNGEPTQNGYTRQAVSSANGFTMVIGSDNNYRAKSSLVSFTATGGSWGPVQNLFIATASSNVGYLISTAQFNPLVSRTLADGESLTMRISVGLTNC